MVAIPVNSIPLSVDTTNLIAPAIVESSTELVAFNADVEFAILIHSESLARQLMVSNLNDELDESIEAASSEIPVLQPIVFASQQPLIIGTSPLVFLAANDSEGRATNIHHPVIGVAHQESPSHPPVPFLSAAPISTVLQAGESGIASQLGSVADLSQPSIAQQAAEAFRTEFVPFQKLGHQSVTIDIHPPELGRIHIQIEMAADHIRAQIVASEALSAEILARDKNLLLHSLSEFGFGQTSVDISHGSLAHFEKQQGQQDFDHLIPIPFLHETDQTPPETNTNKPPVDYGGVNLVA